MTVRVSPRFLARAVLLGSAALPMAALAQAVTISTNQTTPIVTATANNGAPADVTINSGISVTVTSGTAATINSNNTITNSGTIVNSGASNVVGVLFDASNTSGGSFINNGQVQITGTGGSGNIGLLVSGSGSITGTIGGTTTSRFSVSGDNALGVSIAAPFIGNITLGGVGVTGLNSTAISVTAPVTGNIQTYGTIGATGQGSTGIAILAPVSGRVTNGSVIVVGSDATFDSSGKAVPAKPGVAGVRIASSVGGGFVNDRYYVDASGVVQPPPASGSTTTNTLIISSITSYAGAPVLQVAPADTTPITLGAVGTGDDGYAIVNRGRMIGLGRISGTAQTTVQLGRDGLAPGTVTLVGGLANQASSDISATTLDAAATAIAVGGGAVVPTIANAGNIIATATQTAASGSTAASAGGTATGILVQTGGNLGSVVNSGTINVQASGSNAAYGIRDVAGSITSISNSSTGTISATAAAGQIARAIDVSASNATIAISNSGTIKGDVVTGAGNSNVTLSGGTLNGRLALGSGANSLVMSGGASITGAVTSIGQLGVTLSGATTLDLSQAAAPALSSLAMSGSSVLVIGVGGTAGGLQVSGTASFTDTSKLRVAVNSIAPGQSLTLLSAAGGISTDHAASLVDTASIPYLYTLGTVNVGSNTITANLTRKTAADIGIAPGVANFFDQSLLALAGDTTLGAAIGNLPSQAAVFSAYRVLAPASFSSAPLRMAAAMNDAGQAGVSQRLNALRLAGGADELGNQARLGLWVQEYANFLKQKDGSNLPGFSGNTLGIALGVDVPFAGLDAVGVAFNAGWSDVGYGGISGQPLLITTKQFSVYAGKHFGGVFLAAQAGYGFTDYSSRRDFSIGNQSGTITAAWRGTSYGATGTVGYAFKAGRLAITPSDSIAWLTVQQNGYTETGAGALAVTLDKNRQTITTNTAALTAEYVLPAGDGAWRVGARGGYVSQIGTSALSLNGRFAGGNTPFILSADAIRPSELQAGVQFGYSGSGWVAMLGYDHRSSSGFTSQAITGTFRIVM